MLQNELQDNQITLCSGRDIVNFAFINHLSSMFTSQYHSMHLHIKGVGDGEGCSLKPSLHFKMGSSIEFIIP